MVTAGDTGCLSLRRAPNPRETQKTPFLGTDESVTASVLNRMLPGGKNEKTKDLPQPPGGKGGAENMQEGFRLCGYLSGRLSGGQVGGSVYPTRGRSGADAPQGPRERVGREERKTLRH